MDRAKKYTSKSPFLVSLALFPPVVIIEQTRITVNFFTVPHSPSNPRVTEDDVTPDAYLAEFYTQLAYSAHTNTTSEGKWNLTDRRQTIRRSTVHRSTVFLWTRSSLVIRSLGTVESPRAWIHFLDLTYCRMVTCLALRTHIALCRFHACNDLPNFSRFGLYVSDTSLPVLTKYSFYKSKPSQMISPRAMSFLTSTGYLRATPSHRTAVVLGR